MVNHNARAQDISGQRFSNLTVLFRSGRKGKRASWECLCDCGSRVTLGTKELTTGHTKSCGCLRRTPKARATGIIFRNHGTGVAFAALYRSYRYNARKRKYVFELEEDLFRQLTQATCFYCGNTPSSLFKTTNEVYVYNGIDRIDNTAGYVVGNVRACCKYCNRAKSDKSEQEFIRWLDKVTAYRFRADKELSCQ